MRNFFRSFFERRDQPKVEISLAQPGDERAVSEVMYKAWLFAYPNKERGITEDDIHDRWGKAFSEERLAKRRAEFSSPSEKEKVLVAKLNGKIVGMCRAIKEDGGNRIQAIYVDPEVRGKGTGRALWEAAQKFFDPGKDVYVDVVDYNAQAIGFYPIFIFSSLLAGMDECFDVLWSAHLLFWCKPKT